MSGVTELLRAGLEELGLTALVPPDAARTLERYGQLLLEKNQVMNLTAIREPEEAARLHMLDCAALLALPGISLSGASLIDVGTGAGFPGMVLKILVPSLSVTLLDSLNKRLDWLTQTGGALGLTGVSTVHARGEEQAHDPDFRERFDFAAARAVADLQLLCELCLPYVKVGGAFLAMKSVDCREELDRAARAIALLGGGIERLWDYPIPGAGITHRVVLIRKRAPSPERFPRRWAKMQKLPLG